MTLWVKGQEKNLGGVAEVLKIKIDEQVFRKKSNCQVYNL